MTDTDPAASSGETTNGRKPKATRSSSSARSSRKPGDELAGLRARLEGIEPVVNNAFQASGAALLFAILALALGVFLLLKVRGMAA